MGSSEKKGLFKAGEGSLMMKMKWMKALGLAVVLGLAPQAAYALDALAIEAAENSGESSASILARADSLAKGSELDRAIALIEEVLAKEPGNTDARLLYAKTLSWKGEYERAISVYEDVIRQKPGNAEARAGLARVLSWKGEYKLSVEEYRRALEMEPGSVETRTSLARTLWWKGESRAALKELSTVLSKEPNNLEALALERRLRQENGPSLKASYASSSDSDGNDMEALRLSFTDTFGFTGHRFEAGYRLYDASIASRGARAHFFDLKDSIRLSGRSVLTPRLSLVSLDSDSNSTVYLTGGLGFYMPLAKGTSLTAAYSRYPLVDTTTLIENNIRVREAALSLTRETKALTLSASALSASYSDGNSRYDLSGGVSVNLLKEPLIVVGFISEYRDFSERKTSGYFNPPNIFSNTVYVNAEGRVLDKLVYKAKASLGNQSYENKSEYATSIQAGIEWEAARDFSFEALYKYSRSALESASGFRFEEFRAGVNYLF